MKTDIISIGFDKDFEADFSVSASVVDLTDKQIDELRAMAVVGLGIMEDMIRRHRSQREQGKTARA